MKSEHIYIIDLGSQYTRLIIKKVRSLGYASEVISWESFLSQDLKPSAIILSGGPQSVLKIQIII